jgi:hypothetical protein
MIAEYALLYQYWLEYILTSLVKRFSNTAFSQCRVPEITLETAVSRSRSQSENALYWLGEEDVT